MGEKMHRNVANIFFCNREEEGDFFTAPKGLNDREEPNSYPYWMAIFSGVAAIVAGLLTAAFWKPFSMIFGAIVSSSRSIIYIAVLTN